MLMQEFLKGAREQGSAAHEIFLRDLKFSACIECGGCIATGACVLRDDMDSIYTHLRKADIIVLAAPVFFYGLNALSKAMVDRAQCFWAGKYLLNKKLSQERGSRGKGVLLSTGGAKGEKNFDGLLRTVKYFFDALDMDFSDYLTYATIDEKGAIANHATACDDAYRLGKAVLVKP